MNRYYAVQWGKNLRWGDKGTKKSAALYAYGCVDQKMIFHDLGTRKTEATKKMKDLMINLGSPRSTE